MPRWLVIPLLLCLLTAASGGAGFLHEWTVEHDHHDVHEAAHCVIHATLASPAVAGGWTPVLVALGLIVAVLTELPRTRRPRPAFARVDCRGPPTRF